MISQFTWEGTLSFVISLTVFIAILVILVVLYKIILFMTRRALHQQSHASIQNGVKFLVRLVFIIIGFGTFVAFSDSLIPVAIPMEVTLIISTAAGTVIALSTTTVVQNFIAGMYLIATHPYGIGDLVRIGNQEGIVTEISLNHTKLKRVSGTQHYVSNLVILNSGIVNFTMSATPAPGKYRGIETLKHVVHEEKVTRYIVTLDFPKDRPERTRAILNEVAELYVPVFSKKPEFHTTGFLHKANVSIIIESPYPEIILQQKDSFIQAIYERVF